MALGEGVNSSPLGLIRLAEAGRKLAVILAVTAVLTGQVVERASAEPPIRIASFNIQFLGNFKNRDDAGLARILAPFDLVFVQELVGPPYSGTFTNGNPFRPDKEARRFFEEMKGLGFSFLLSEEDTGTGENAGAIIPH